MRSRAVRWAVTVVPALTLAAFAPAAFPEDGGGSAVYVLSGDLQVGEAARVRELARWAQAGGARELVVVLDSEGGVAQEGLALFSALRSAPLPTRCIVQGAAASAAFVALQGCRLRQARRAAVLATHNPMIVFPLAGTTISVEKAQAASARISALAEAFAQAVAPRMGLTTAEYRKRIANGEVWQMTALEAVKAGALDSVID